jgi:hypothetical protein
MNIFPPKKSSSASHGQSTKTEFNAFPATYPGSSPHTNHDLADLHIEAPHTQDVLIATSEASPPSLPYSWELCSSNTFACNDCTVSAQSLREKVMDIVRKSPADITCNSEWQFTGTFYLQQVKTVFEVSIFNNDTNTRRKKSCLLEMQLQEGDRVAFQGLCSYVQSQANLAYAFADEWGFDEVEGLNSNWDQGYQHRSFAPPPLPRSLLAKMEQIDMTALPFMDASKNCLVDILLENASSAFIDVRRTGWQELAKATEDENTAEALLQTSVNGEECISLGARVLREDSTCELTEDTQRCVLKTLLNIVETRDVDACRKISALKVDINKLAEDVGNSAEARSTATRLIQCLA